MTALHFEIISYAVWAVIAGLLLTVWRGHRDHWWLFLGLTLSFPFEWIADNFWMFLQYDWSFTMMFGRVPLMMPFAWGWFFTIALVLMLRNKEKIDRLPLWGQILGIYVTFFLWDFLVEYGSTGFGLWTYYWPEKYLIGGVSWFIPAAVGTAFLMYYYGHLWLLKYSADKTWAKGFVIHLGGYYAIGTFRAIVGWIITVQIMGITPTGMEVVLPW
jgi:hypothetical protein